MTIGRNFIQGQANRVLKKVAGNLVGNVFGETTTSPTAALNRKKGSMSGIKGSEDFDHLAFPFDVLSDESTGNHGHYIMFYVNEQDKAKIRFADRVDGKQNVVNEAVQRKIDNQLKEMYQKMNGELNPNAIGTQAISEQVIEGVTNENVHSDLTERSKPFHALTPPKRTYKNYKGRSFFVERAKVHRTKMAITMYMPAQVTTTYGANYTDTQIGLFSDQAMQAFNALVNQNFDNFGNIVGNLDENLKSALNGIATTFLGGIPTLGGIKEVEAMKEGRIFADKMELAFKGIPKRQFQYTFKMMPKSKKEAEEVRKIVKAFKQNMLPEFLGGPTSRKLLVPNTFDIQYMYVNSENQFLHKIGESVLENMTVTYGGDRYRTFEGELGEGAPPVETSITLAFKEFDFLTREKIVEGY